MNAVHPVFGAILAKIAPPPTDASNPNFLEYQQTVSADFRYIVEGLADESCGAGFYADTDNPLLESVAKCWMAKQVIPGPIWIEFEKIVLAIEFEERN